MKKPSVLPSRKRKGNPIPVRFDGPEEKVLGELATATGLNQAEIIRRAGRFAFPKFLSREVNILDVIPTNGKAVPA
jgi:hypothetical protein